MPLKANVKMLNKQFCAVMGRIVCDNASKKHTSFGCAGEAAGTFASCFCNLQREKYILI